MRLAVYTDYSYRRDKGEVFAERAFVLFLGELARHVERLVLVGRLDPREGRFERSHYRVAPEIDFRPLPHYDSLARPGAALRAALGTGRAFWRSLAGVDVVWLLGPHPFGLLFVLLSVVRGRRVFLGVRQDLPRYARTRHPGRRAVHVFADALEVSWRGLALFCPSIVVGPDLAERYRRGRRVLPIAVSLIRAADVLVPGAQGARSYDGELTALSVGRLEAEKNPLMLADVLARLDPRWRLVICGEGPLEHLLGERLEELGVAGRARLAGYVPVDGGLLGLYRESHALLHVSWTEGVPQIIFEAFAAGLPAVLTDVGGVAETVGTNALLVAPGDADAAATALASLAGDPQLRQRLASGGAEVARAHTIESECARVAAFMARGGGRSPLSP